LLLNTKEEDSEVDLTNKIGYCKIRFNEHATTYVSHATVQPRLCNQPPGKICSSYRIVG